MLGQWTQGMKYRTSHFSQFSLPLCNHRLCRNSKTWDTITDFSRHRHSHLHHYHPLMQLACVAGAKRGGGRGRGEGEGRKGKGKGANSSSPQSPFPFSLPPYPLSPTPYPFRRLLRRLHAVVVLHQHRRTRVFLGRPNCATEIISNNFWALRLIIHLYLISAFETKSLWHY